MRTARRPVQAKPRAPSLREQWVSFWDSLKRVLSVLFTWAISLGLLALLVLAGWVFWQKLQVPITTIQISGAAPEVSATWVRTQLKPWIGQDIWQADLSAVRQQLLKNTWLTDAEVQRVWPNALAVHIAIHHPIARWQGDQLLDTEGNVFRPSAAPHGLEMESALPSLNGPDGQQWPIWERYLSFKPALQSVGLVMTGLSEDSRGSLDVMVQGGVRIRLGGQQIEQRLQRLLDVYGKTLAGKMDQISTIDLRYTNGFAVQWREPKSGQPSERHKSK